MARQTALAMASFGGEGMLRMGNLLRHHVAQIMQHVLLRGVDHVCMWGPCSHIERECLAAAAQQQPTNPHSQPYLKMCVAREILSAEFVIKLEQ